MAFPTTAIIDGFNRANEGPPPSANWSSSAGLNGLQVDTNLCRSSSGVGFGYWNAATFGPDSECYITVTTKGGNGELAAAYARLQSPSSFATLDGYTVFMTVAAGTDTFSVQRIDNGVGTTLGSTVSQELTNGDSLGIEIIGSTIKAQYRSGTGAWRELASRSDSTYSGSGNIAAASGGTTYRIDDFGGGTIPVYEQEGFRFRNDDGSETTATWRQNQDVDDSVDIETPLRLRVLVNATADPLSQGYTLQVRKQGAGDNAWRDVKP